MKINIKLSLTVLVINISKYNKTLEEDLDTILLNKNEQIELNTINPAYSLIEWSRQKETKKWNIYEDGRIPPVEEDVLNNTIIPLPPLSM